ncbi:unnamed protein product, partial [Ixodes hexagonus]
SISATHTDLRTSRDLRELVYKFGSAMPISRAHIVEGTLTPLSPYSVQKVKIELLDDMVPASRGKPRIIYLGLRIQNEMGVYSPVSNFVTVTWDPRPKYSSASPTTTSSRGPSAASEGPPVTTESSKEPHASSKASPTASDSVVAVSGTTTSTESTWVVPYTEKAPPEETYEGPKGGASYISLLVAAIISITIASMVVLGIYVLLCERKG